MEFAKPVLEELAKRTHDECLAGDAKARQIVIRMNIGRAKLRAKRVFQIDYAEGPALRRTELLKSRGYSVMEVIGNRAAKAVLSSIPHCDFFIVGDDAPEQTRMAMVDWLKAHYPRVKVLAFNPRNQQVANADYNVLENGPENWLSIISQELGDPASATGA